MPYIGQGLTEGRRRVETFIATANQTTFNIIYDAGYVDVYQNGILLAEADYTATNGSQVVLAVGAALNDEITIIAHQLFSVTDTVSATQGGTFTGAITASGGVVGNVTGTVSNISNHLLDEDNMASNDATKVPSQQSVKAYVDTEVSGLVDSAPSTLDTLNELAAALGDDANFSTTITNSIATKLPLAGGTLTGNLTMENTDAGSAAGPEFVLFRNSASAADADYLGQIKFDGKNDAGQSIVYAKITGKILDASDGTEDGIIEIAHKKAGSNNISARFRSDSLQLINGTNLTVAGTTDLTGDLTVDTNTLHVDTSNGNVGIGTADPNGKLTVALENSNTPAFRLASPTSSTDFAISNYNDANGTYVSMGVNHLFDVSGNDAVMDTNDKSAAIVLDGRNNGRIQFLTNSSGIATPRMSILQDGNVGIGTTDPSRPLEIVASTGANALRLRARSNDDYAFIQFSNYAGTTLRGQIYSHQTTGSIGFTTGTDSSAGDDLYISDSGGVGINTTTTGGYSGRLTVYQDINGTYTPTGFLDKPTMQLRHTSSVDGYTGIRYSNNNGTYEWFTGAHQKDANAADLVVQGFDRQLSTYRENQRIYDTGQIVQPRQPSFSAHKTSHLALSGAGQSEAGGWSTSYVSGAHNVGGHFNTSTGRFTVPVAGRYKFDANIMHGITSGDFQIWLCVNGNTSTNIKSNSMQSTGGNWKQTTVTGIFNLAASDYISIFVRSSAAEPYAMYGSTTSAFTTCNGYLIG